MWSLFAIFKQYSQILSSIKNSYKGEIKIKHTINDEIRANKVMLVGLENQGKVEVTLEEALNMAEQQELDLVQMSSNGSLAVCKIMDYKKYEYEQKKKERKNTKVKQELKEVRFNDGIADNDLRIKAKTANRIIEEGDKVKVTIIYKGRLISFINRGIAKLNNFETLVEPNHTVDVPPRIEGNRVYMIISPKK